MSDIPIYYHTTVLGVDIGEAPPETNDQPRNRIETYPHSRQWGRTCIENCVRGFEEIDYTTE